jgi:hypothetical protein
MKKFLLKIALFSFLITGLFTILLLCLPSKQYHDSILASLTDKHQMLDTTPSPRIIFVGGSSLSMGLNSKLIADAYHMPVINTGIAIWPGLKFMVKDLKPRIKKGDIIVLAAEYSCYDESLDETGFEGYEQLLAILFDIYPQGRQYIDARQWLLLAKFVPHYTMSQIKCYTDRQPANLPGSGRLSFNRYGDYYQHWNVPKIPFKLEGKSTGNERLNPRVMPFLKDFNTYVKAKGATLVILPPPMQKQSFQNKLYIINKIALALKANGMPFLAPPAKYAFDDRYMNDFVFHLTKAGLDIRTGLVIQDLEKVVRSKAN